MILSGPYNLHLVFLAERITPFPVGSAVTPIACQHNSVNIIE